MNHAQFLSIIFLAAFLASGCIGGGGKYNAGPPSATVAGGATQANPAMMGEDMELKTTDGMKIAATYFKSGNNAKEAAILLHMLNRNRNDWNDFARKLQPDYEVIAIDFRGHGDSSGDLNAFTTDDFKKFTLDVKAAREFLSNRGKKVSVVIGGSIGANIALNFAAENEIERAALLSPGLDYRGVETEPAARKYLGKALLVASEDDAYAASSTRRLYDMMLAKKQIKIYQNAGHGTKMFASTDLDELILGWLKSG